VLIAIVTIGLAVAWYIYYAKKPGSPCFLKMAFLSDAIRGYNDRYGEVPDPNKWCDLIIEHITNSTGLFLCPKSDAIEGESSYAMNKNLMGMKFEDIPNDVGRVI